MRIESAPCVAIDWRRAEVMTQPGASGTATSRVQAAGDVRVRLVEYSPGYLADHWCSKGHVIYVVSGALAIEHEEGTPPRFLEPGMSWCVGDGEGPAHRVRSEAGATVFILD